MERLVAIANWQTKGRADAILNQILKHRSPPLRDNLSAEFSCASSIKTNTTSIISDPCGLKIICDARIDNREEISNLLFNHTSFSASQLSDGEIILAAYKKWGRDSANRLIGDFSFIIWDSAQKRLYAARDPMNMRTLYYARVGEDLCIASDAQVLLNHPLLTCKINKASLAGWVSGWPDPDASLFEGIECLPAGHSISASANQFSVQRFWNIDTSYKLRYSQLAEYEEHLHELLGRCVSDRLRSDSSVVGSQMSGGMDSTSVTAFANKTLHQQNRSLMVISHSYAATKNCDETEHIIETASHLGLNNTHMLAAEKHLNLDFASLYPPSLESPGTVLSPRYIDEMEMLKSAGANVLLTGSGGDEMCWGHSLTYSQRLKRGSLAVLPEVIRGCREMQLPVGNTLLNLFIKPLLPQPFKSAAKHVLGKSKHSLLPAWIPPGAAKQFGLEESMQGNTDTHFKNPALQARYEALQRTSTFNSVRSYQRVGASYGIDVRHPFFDRRLAEFSFAIPDDLWIRENRPKWLLRRVMNQHLPASVCWNKQKIIFDSFFGNILRSQADSIRSILSDTRLQEMGLVDNKRLLAAFDASVNGPQASLNVDLLYALLTQIWFQKYATYFEGWS